VEESRNVFVSIARDAPTKIIPLTFAFFAYVNAQGLDELR
jgi:hypothetical protein